MFYRLPFKPDPRDREWFRSLSINQQDRIDLFALPRWSYAQWLGNIRGWERNERNDCTDHPLYAAHEGAD